MSRWTHQESRKSCKPICPLPGEDSSTKSTTEDSHKAMSQLTTQQGCILRNLPHRLTEVEEDVLDNQTSSSQSAWGHVAIIGGRAWISMRTDPPRFSDIACAILHHLGQALDVLLPNHVRGSPGNRRVSMDW